MSAPFLPPLIASAAPILYKHALESIFAFLCLRDLNSALAVSQLWFAAALSLPCVGGVVAGCRDSAARLASEGSIEALCRSPLAVRHLSQIGGQYDPFKMNASQLALAAQCLQGLRILHLAMKLRRGSSLIEVPLFFPPRLTHLSLKSLSGGRARADIINTTLVTIARLPLLQCCHIHLLQADAKVSFAPFCSTPLLTEFGFRPIGSLDGSVPDERVNELRAMPNLTRLRFSEQVDVILLARLLRAPFSQLKWQRIQVDEHYFGSEECELLSTNLPSLTSLHASVGSRVDFLKRLPSLTTLNMHASYVEPDNLLAGLQSCTNLTRLDVNHCSLKSTHLCQLMPSLPHLRDLRLWFAQDLESLICFTASSIRASLHHLTLHACGGRPHLMSCDELVHLHGLRELTSLNLSHSFRPQEGDQRLAAFEPPSMLLPTLKEFTALHAAPRPLLSAILAD